MGQYFEVCGWTQLAGHFVTLNAIVSSLSFLLHLPPPPPPPPLLFVPLPSAMDTVQLKAKAVLSELAEFFMNRPLELQWSKDPTQLTQVPTAYSVR